MLVPVTYLKEIKVFEYEQMATLLSMFIEQYLKANLKTKSYD